MRNKLNECPKIKTKDIFNCYIYDNKLDKLGRKEEFGLVHLYCIQYVVGTYRQFHSCVFIFLQNQWNIM